MLPTLFHDHHLPLNAEKSWIIGTQVFSQVMQSALPLRHYDDGGKILGVPIGALPSSLAWIEAHFAEKAPPPSVYLGEPSEKDLCHAT